MLIKSTQLKWVLEEYKKNVELSEEPVSYAISKLKKESSKVDKQGKNYYVEVDDCRITINSSSFTIITAHKN